MTRRIFREDLACPLQRAAKIIAKYGPQTTPDLSNKLDIEWFRLGRMLHESEWFDYEAGRWYVANIVRSQLLHADRACCPPWNK